MKLIDPIHLKLTELTILNLTNHRRDNEAIEFEIEKQ